MNRIALVTILALLAAIDVVSAGPALAASFAVNSTNDAVDALPGNGVCETTTPGECTLRAAIQEANASPGPHTVSVPAGTYLLTIAGADEDQAATGDLDVHASISIVGAGAAITMIDGAGLDRVLDVATGSSDEVNLSGVTIQGGFAGAGTDGAGIRNRQSSSLTLTNVDVSANLTDWAGGGISNWGTLSLNASNITGNTQQGAGTVPMGGGGLSILGGDVSISDSTIGANTAWRGGGIWSEVGLAVAGSLTVNDSSIDGNTATDLGGGVFFLEGTANFSGTTIANNTAVHGGGIFGQGADVTLTNTTVSGNSATVDGGGIAHCYCRFRNVTIADNTADSDADGTGDGGGMALGDPAVQNDCCAELRNSIIAGNIDRGGEMPNIACLGDSVLHSQAYNLMQDLNIRVPEVYPGCTVQGDVTGNIVGQPALLGPLAYNGGPTMTHPLLPGSPAIDSGNPAIPGSGGYACETADQRGTLRPQGARCDMGAYEKPPAPPPVGGIAELPDPDVLPPAAPSGGSRALYVITAAVTLAIAASGAAAWRRHAVRKMAARTAHVTTTKL